MNWLFDTNVISESRRAKPSAAVAQWVSAIPLSQSFTSSMVLAELVYGAALTEDLMKRATLQQWIDQVVRNWSHGRTLEIDEPTLVRWRVIRQKLEKQRKPAPAVDLLIAATAIQHGLGVATRYTAPFIACGVPVLNPWTGERFNGA